MVTFIYIFLWHTQVLYITTRSTYCILHQDLCQRTNINLIIYLLPSVTNYVPSVTIFSFLIFPLVWLIIFLVWPFLFSVVSCQRTNINFVSVSSYVTSVIIFYLVWLVFKVHTVFFTRISASRQTSIWSFICYLVWLIMFLVWTFYPFRFLL